MDKGKKRYFNHFGYLFQRHKIMVFAHLNKFEFYLLEESSISLGRLFYTAQGLYKI
jgi:hypothetical protein